MVWAGLQPSRFAREVLPPSNTSVICSQWANCLQRLISVSVRLAINAA